MGKKKRNVPPKDLSKVLIRNMIEQEVVKTGDITDACLTIKNYIAECGYRQTTQKNFEEVRYEMTTGASINMNRKAIKNKGNYVYVFVEFIKKLFKMKGSK